MSMRRPMAEAALASAITTSRKGRKAPARFQRTGRLDRRAVYKVATGDCRVFKRQIEPAQSRIRVTILLDLSGSMRHRLGNATQVARDLAGATDRLPWVTADLIGFTTGNGGAAIYPIWKTGEPTQNVDRAGMVSMGGTDEGAAIAWALDDLLAAKDASEAALIIIISDGMPGSAGHVKWVAQQANRQGVPVIGVSIVPGLTKQQYDLYGRDNVVEFTHNPKVLARGLAKVIGRVI